MREHKSSHLDAAAQRLKTMQQESCWGSCLSDPPTLSACRFNIDLTRAFDWCDLRHQSFDLRRVTAILLQQKNFGPNVIYYVFWESGGPSADDVGSAWLDQGTADGFYKNGFY